MIEQRDIDQAKIMDAILTLDPVPLIKPQHLRQVQIGWTDNLRALWVFPQQAPCLATYDDHGIDITAYSVRRQYASLAALFAAECPHQDMRFFSDEGAPADVAIATVRAFRDWRRARKV